MLNAVQGYVAVNCASIISSFIGNTYVAGTIQADRGLGLSRLEMSSVEIVLRNTTVVSSTLAPLQDMFALLTWAEPSVHNTSRHEIPVLSRESDPTFCLPAIMQSSLHDCVIAVTQGLGLVYETIHGIAC